MKINTAPICLFVYARLEVTKKTIESLKKCHLSSESDLHIFSDGPKEGDEEKVTLVREYINSISGFKSISIYESKNNNGLAKSIISGVSKILSSNNSVIVIEDDLVLSNGFLNYINQALLFYENKNNILSISGYALPINYPKGYKYHATFGLRASSWGWATWKNRWEVIDWEARSYKNFKFNVFKRILFNRGGSDMSHMLDKQMSGKINSWAIRFCFHQFQHKMFDVFPTKSLVDNIGWGAEASNCQDEAQSWETNFWSNPPDFFEFPSKVITTPSTINQFYRHNGFTARIKRFIKRKFN